MGDGAAGSSSNGFEAGARKCIPAVLIYARSGNQVLMIHRNSDKKEHGGQPDYHRGKWNGLGGKCDPDESPLETARRELEEESGLSLPLESFQALGVIQFPNFKPHKAEDWVVFVFSADVPAALRNKVSRDSAEGEVHWIDAEKLLDLNLWAGDRHFIPLVAKRRAFMGTIWYKGEEVARHWIEPL